MKRCRLKEGLGDCEPNISPLTRHLKLIHAAFIFKALHRYEQHHMPLTTILFTQAFMAVSK